jgi:hypothetical protein
MGYEKSVKIFGWKTVLPNPCLEEEEEEEEEEETRKKRKLGRPGRSWEVNITMNLR